MVKPKDLPKYAEKFVEKFNKNADGYFNTDENDYRTANKHARAILKDTRILVENDRELAINILKQIACSKSRGPNIYAAIFLYSLDKDFAIQCGQAIVEEEDRIGTFAKGWLQNVKTGWFRPVDF
jgi:hypothetical protein